MSSTPSLALFDGRVLHGQASSACPRAVQRELQGGHEQQLDMGMERLQHGGVVQPG
jgi:hypothetical protein